MSRIEWEDTEELKPTKHSLADFCQENHLPWLELPTAGLMAFIEYKALESLQHFLAEDTQREHGGVLLGNPYYDPTEDRHFVVIHHAIPAFGTEGSPVHLQFTAEAWSSISGWIDEEFPGLPVVGWYHSHPGLGVFMSGTDRSTQKAFFNHMWNLAVVVDPIARQTGWFRGTECERLDHRHVIPYEKPKAIEPRVTKSEETLSPLEIEYRQKYSYDNLRWLLPVGIFLISGLVGWLWYLDRNRG